MERQDVTVGHARLNRLAEAAYVGGHPWIRITPRPSLR